MPGQGTEGLLPPPHGAGQEGAGADATGSGAPGTQSPSPSLSLSLTLPSSKFALIGHDTFAAVLRCMDVCRHEEQYGVWQSMRPGGMDPDSAPASPTAGRPNHGDKGSRMLTTVRGGRPYGCGGI